MIGRRHWVSAAFSLAALTAAAAYLHDPPWVGGITSGLRGWSRDASGTRFRWTNGHAAFYVPSGAAWMTLPIRAGLPRPDGKPPETSIYVDGRFAADVSLGAPLEWTQVTVPLPGHATRRFRRIEVRVKSVVSQSNYGVQLGEVALYRRGGAR